MKVNIFTEFSEIVKGNQILKRTVRGRKQERDFAVFVFPDNDKALNDCAFRYLEAYCDYNGTKELFLVATADVHMPEATASLKGKCEIRMVIIDDQQMRYVLHFCATFREPYLVVMSLDKPYGRYTYRMIGHKGLTLDDLVCRFIYNMKHIPEITEREV